PPQPPPFPYTTLFRSDHTAWAPFSISDGATSLTNVTVTNPATSGDDTIYGSGPLTLNNVNITSLPNSYDTIDNYGPLTANNVTIDRKSTRLNSSHVKI